MIYNINAPNPISQIAAQEHRQRIREAHQSAKLYASYERQARNGEIVGGIDVADANKRQAEKSASFGFAFDEMLRGEYGVYY